MINIHTFIFTTQYERTTINIFSYLHQNLVLKSLKCCRLPVLCLPHLAEATTGLSLPLSLSVWKVSSPPAAETDVADFCIRACIGRELTANGIMEHWWSRLRNWQELKRRLCGYHHGDGSARQAGVLQPAPLATWSLEGDPCHLPEHLSPSLCLCIFTVRPKTSSMVIRVSKLNHVLIARWPLGWSRKANCGLFSFCHGSQA